MYIVESVGTQVRDYSFINKTYQIERGKIYERAERRKKNRKKPNRKKTDFSHTLFISSFWPCHRDAVAFFSLSYLFCTYRNIGMYNLYTHFVLFSILYYNAFWFDYYLWRQKKNNNIPKWKWCNKYKQNAFRKWWSNWENEKNRRGKHNKVSSNLWII